VNAQPGTAVAFPETRHTSRRGVAGALRAALAGSVLGPGDPGYDEARRVFLPGFDRHPGAIARPADAGEVAEVVAFARERDVALAVRGGGHSYAGHGTMDWGIVLDLTGLGALRSTQARASRGPAGA
jgi:FAD/FMN-containing dehydrogenase